MCLACTFLFYYLLGAHPLAHLARNDTQGTQETPNNFYIPSIYQRVRVQKRMWTFFDYLSIMRRPTVCVTCAGRGRRSRPTGKMLRRRKLLDAKRAARPTGSPQRQVYAARFVFGLRHFTREYLYAEVSRYFFLFTHEVLAFN